MLAHPSQQKRLMIALPRAAPTLSVVACFGRPRQTSAWVAALRALGAAGKSPPWEIQDQNRRRLALSQQRWTAVTQLLHHPFSLRSPRSKRRLWGTEVPLRSAGLLRGPPSFAPTGEVVVALPMASLLRCDTLPWGYVSAWSAQQMGHSPIHNSLPPPIYPSARPFDLFHTHENFQIISRMDHLQPGACRQWQVRPC